MDRDNYPTIFHIDIDAFFASVEESLCPALKGQPVVVGGLPGDRGVVACPNYAARKLGVKTAMPLSQAFKLAPKAAFVRGNYKAYVQYSRKFVGILYEFSPSVQPVSLDEAFLDADGCLHFWNYDVARMAAAIKSKVMQELGITVSIGIASNKTCAKVATDFSKKSNVRDNSGQTLPPNGLCVVFPGEEKKFLRVLPVSALPGIGKRTSAALISMGIPTLGKLAETDTVVLKKIFGVSGVYLHNAANGIGASTVDDIERDPRSISRSTTFGEDSNNIEFISSAFFYLSEKIGRELRKIKLAASTVNVKMRYSDGAPLLGYRKGSDNSARRFVTYQKSITLDGPVNSEFEIAEAALKLFSELWLHGTKVRYIGVGVTNIGDQEIQTDLFDRTSAVHFDLLRSVDGIREKFGNDSVYFGIVEKIGKRLHDHHVVFGMGKL